jgi:hypothetical protein
MRNNSLWATGAAAMAQIEGYVNVRKGFNERLGCSSAHPRRKKERRSSR